MGFNIKMLTITYIELFDFRFIINKKYLISLIYKIKILLSKYFILMIKK